jgi:hypothetical protein
MGLAARIVRRALGDVRRGCRSVASVSLHSLSGGLRAEGAVVATLVPLVGVLALGGDVHALLVCH